MDLLKALSKKAFWDVDMKTMDAENHAGFIIVKVFEFGTLHDIRAVLRYYGKPRVREALLEQPFLHSDTLNFAASLFKVPKESFQCYTKTRLRKNVGTSLRS